MVFRFKAYFASTHNFLQDGHHIRVYWTDDQRRIQVQTTLAIAQHCSQIRDRFLLLRLRKPEFTTWKHHKYKEGSWLHILFMSWYSHIHSETKGITSLFGISELLIYNKSRDIIIKNICVRVETCLPTPLQSYISNSWAYEAILSHIGYN